MGLSNTAVPREYGAFREAVLSGEIPVNEEISLHMQNIDYLIAHPDYYYDDEAIDGFIRFAEEEMTLTDGSDLWLTPAFKLWAEDLFAWYYFIERKVYNPKKRSYEYNRIKLRLRNKQYLIVGRGAAKSVYAELVQAYGLIVDTTTTHQVITAPTMAQAEETIGPFRTAITIAKGPLMQFMTTGDIRSNTFTKVKLASTKKGIQNFLTNSLLEIRPMAINKLQGLRSKYNTVDEWLSGHVNQDVIETIEQGASKLDDWIIVATSSEGTERDGVGDEIKMELNDILTGAVFNPHVSIFYYKLDDVKEITNPEMWIKANPNLGITVSYDTYQRAVETCETVPSKRNDILAKRFGIPVEGYTFFFSYEDTLVHPRVTTRNMDCAMGGDLSQGDDFCAFTFLFPLRDETYAVKTLSFVSENKVAKLSTVMQDKYNEFIKEGTLIKMPGINLNIKDVYAEVWAHILRNKYNVLTFGYDPYNAEEFVNEWIIENGEYGLEVVKQGVRTESVPLGEIRNVARERQLFFDQELMKWTMGNSIVMEDNNGNLKLSKRRAPEKIDNVAALMDAWVAYKRNREEFM